MVDLVVDLVTNMMDYRGSSNMNCWGSINNSGNWGSFHFHSFDCSNSRSGNSGGSKYMSSRDYSSSIVTNSRYNSSSIGNNRSSLHLNSLYLRNNWSCCIDTSYQSMSVGKILSLCIRISSRCCKSAGSKGKNNQELHTVKDDTSRQSPC